MLDTTWKVDKPSGKLTQLAGKPPFLQGDTSSNGGFPMVNIVVLGYRCVTVPT